MNSSSSEASIEIENISYQLVSIDEYSFTAEIDLPVGIRSHGILQQSKTICGNGNVVS